MVRPWPLVAPVHQPWSVAPASVVVGSSGAKGASLSPARAACHTVDQRLKQVIDADGAKFKFDADSCTIRLTHST